MIRKIDKNSIGEALRAAYDHCKNDAGGKNADYIPYLKNVPSHLFGIAACLPDVDDVKEGIIAARIAAHAADIAKGVPGAAEWDYKMSEARKRLDWEGMFALAMDPEKARRYRAESKPEKEDTEVR